MTEAKKGTTWQVEKKGTHNIDTCWIVCDEEKGPQTREQARLTLRTLRKRCPSETYRLIRIPPPRSTVEERIEAARVEERKAIGAILNRVPLTPGHVIEAADALARGERP